MLIIFKITALLIPVTAFTLGIFSLFKNPQSKVVRLWFLSSMAIGAWGVGLSMVLFAQAESFAVSADKLIVAASVLIPILFYHFISAFLYKEKRDLVLLGIGYISAIIFLFLDFNNILIVGASPRLDFKFWMDTGEFYNAFFVYFLIYSILAFVNLLVAYKKNDGARKDQIFYILIATIIGFVGGTTDFFPEVFNLYPFGHFVVFVYPIFMTYGLFLKK